MVAITKSAVKELKTIVEAETRLKHADCGLRIYVAGVGDHGITYGLELDSVRHDHDIVLDIGGSGRSLTRRSHHRCRTS